MCIAELSHNYWWLRWMVRMGPLQSVLPRRKDIPFQDSQLQWRRSTSSCLLRSRRRIQRLGRLDWLLRQLRRWISDQAQGTHLWNSTTRTTNSVSVKTFMMIKFTCADIHSYFKIYIVQFIQQNFFVFQAMQHLPRCLSRSWPLVRLFPILSRRSKS